MKKISKHKHIDRQVRGAFDELVNMASCSHLMGEIARHPKWRHEETIEGLFRTILRAKLKGKVNILLDQRRENYGYMHDIVGERNSRVAVVVEIKAPFTDSGGISGKTEKAHGFPKDVDALGKAMGSGVPLAYELVVMFECYAVNRKGKRIKVPNVKSWEEYGIKWPTEQGYDPKEGENEVSTALKRLAKGRSLKAKRIKGWDRIELPRPKPNIRAFLDCALYKVQLK